MNLFTLRVNLSLKNSQKTFGSSMVKNGEKLGYINMICEPKWSVILEEIHWMFCVIGLGISKLPQILKEWDLI